MLLAIENANGGELAGLEQILVAFEGLFQRRMQPEAYAASCALLCEAGLVEGSDESLGLTPEGRKLLRRTGVPGTPERPHRVAEQLALIEELDLAPAGSMATPDAAAFTAAASSLEEDGQTGDEPVLGAQLAPQTPSNLGWGLHPVPAARRLVFPLHHRGAGLPEVPLVAPYGEEPAEPPEDGPAS
jgi:hypothetical protein